jgi:hypothetical protein
VNGLTESEPAYQQTAVWLDTTGAAQSPDACTPANAGDARTRIIAGGTELTDAATIGGRFSETDSRPARAWTLVYVLPEHARQAQHPDAAEC